MKTDSKAVNVRLEKAFSKAGRDKMSFRVKRDNPNVVSFCRRLGYELGEDIVAMSKFIQQKKKEKKKGH